MEELINFCIQYGYVGMLLSAFIAGSVLPFSSEAVIIALMGAGLNVWLLLLFATIGNVLGGMTCYGIGSMGKTEWIAKVFRIKPEKMARAQRFVDKGGAWAAFWAFVPGLGSAIVIALGLMRANMFITTFSMTMGKLLRYIIVIFSAWEVMSLYG